MGDPGNRCDPESPCRVAIARPGIFATAIPSLSQARGGDWFRAHQAAGRHGGSVQLIMQGNSKMVG
jgi:hypothetical protein